MLPINSTGEAPSYPFAQFKKYSKQGKIFRQGEISEGYYLVTSGSVKLQKTLPNGSQAILKILGPGEIFGEGESKQLPVKRNNSSAIALEESTFVQKITGEDFQNAAYGFQLQDKLHSYSLEITLRLERLTWMDVEGRIKFTLHDLAQKLGKRFGGETLLKVNLTHEELGMLSDSSRQTVTKTLSRLKKDGKITYSRNRILFRNLSTFN